MKDATPAPDKAPEKKRGIENQVSKVKQTLLRFVATEKGEGFLNLPLFLQFRVLVVDCGERLLT